MLRGSQIGICTQKPSKRLNVLAYSVQILAYRRLCTLFVREQTQSSILHHRYTKALHKNTKQQHPPHLLPPPARPLQHFIQQPSQRWITHAHAPRLLSCKSALRPGKSWRPRIMKNISRAKSRTVLSAKLHAGLSLHLHQHLITKRNAATTGLQKDDNFLESIF